MNHPTNHVREFFANVIDSVGDGVIVLDNTGIVTLMNPAAEELTGVSRKQAQGSPFAAIFGEEAALREMVEKTSTTGMIISDYENLVLKKSSQIIPVSATTSPLLLADGERTGTILVLRDLTNIRELEAAVRQADRLSTLGTLAAGLAHEIKNPLGGIKGAAQLLERELPGGSELVEYIKVMLKEVGRVNKIVEELLNLTSPRKLKLVKTNLNQVLDEIIMLQKRMIDRKKISLVKNFDLSIPPFLADEGLMTQLFLNLIKNAVEALGESCAPGSIKITSRVVSDYSLTKKGERPSRFVAVDISDDGPGITKEQIEHIFTPFFTTKSKGTGLGLSICQKIVSEHRGMLKVDSGPGKGTIFTVMLPLIM
ncbi:MAG TPA: ATP-binding protein [Geobacteraceae bacterium]|nr:ATP-binding protein [Geobacteraceae bacterium]